MKIIHCADIHLGSKMERNLTKLQAKERKNEIYNNFVRLIEYADANNINHIIIAGYLFDTEKGNVRLIKDTILLFSKNSNISFYYLRGNHDEAVLSGYELPSNVYTFTDDFKYYDVENVRIGGKEVVNSKDVYFKDDKFNILVLHGNVVNGKPINEEDLNLKDFREKNINYLALGHIHMRKDYQVDENFAASYCGCLEGRGFDECGEKGFYVLDIKENNLKQTFVPFYKRMCHEVIVDITGAKIYTDIVLKIKENSKDVRNVDLVKVILTGEYEIDLNKNLDAVKEKLESNYYFIKIEDQSKLRLDYNDYINDVSLLGEFVRTVIKDDTIENKDEVLTYGIKALRNEEI